MHSLNNSNVVPIDVLGVKKIGVGRWFQSFHWPIHPEEFQALWLDMQTCFLQIAHDAPRPHKDILYATLKVHLYLAQLVYVLLAERKAKQAGKRLLIHDETILTELLDVERGKIPAINQLKSPIHYPWVDRIKPYLRAIKRTLMDSDSIFQTLLQFHAGPKYLATSSRNPVFHAYCRQNRIYPLFIPVEIFLCSEETVPDSKWQAIIRDLSGGFKEIIERYTDALASAQKSYINDYVTENLNVYWSLFHGVIKRLRSFPQSRSWTLFACSLGSPIHKILYQALRYNGGKVIGVSHSTAFARPLTSNICINEIALCDQYIVGGQHEKSIFEFYINRYRNKYDYMPTINPKSILYAKDIYYMVSEGKASKTDDLAPIRKVMMFGAPYNSYQSHLIPGAFGIKWLYLELQIVALLKAAGFYVIYKAHPDRLKECAGLFEYRVDLILTEPFENEAVWTQADCFLNVSWGTHSHAFSLRTKKPIILIDTIGVPWPEDLLGIIKRRCFFVRTKFDEHNRVVVVEEDLLGALNTLKGPDLRDVATKTQVSFGNLLQ